jgi:hypothetical protein
MQIGSINVGGWTDFTLKISLDAVFLHAENRATDKI